MPRIKDVARVAGVSTATVSYVLNNTKKVSPAVKERVQGAARELGYRPSLAAQQLASGRSQLLAMMVSDIRNPFFPEIITEFQDQAIANGLDALVLNTNYDDHRIKVGLERLLSLRVPGVAIMTSQIEAGATDLLAQKGIATVHLDHGGVGPRTSVIRVDYEAGVADALQHIYSLGHRRIGFIGGPPHLQSAQRRKDAFIRRASELPDIETCLIDSDFTVQGGYFACSKLLPAFRPEAVFCGNDLSAIGALHAAYDRRLRIPGDLSVLGFDDITFAQYCQPALSTVAVPRSAIGKLAFQALWRHLEEPAAEGMEYYIRPTLVIRESTRLSAGERGSGTSGPGLS